MLDSAKQPVVLKIPDDPKAILAPKPPENIEKMTTSEKNQYYTQ